MLPEKLERGWKRDEKERYRTCCAVCHIKFGTVLLGSIEAVVAICVLIGVTRQIMWKNESSSSCSRNLFRDCLIFQFNHFNVTLILDYIVLLMMVCILASILMMMCGIISDTSCLILPHLGVQALFLLFSLGYFLFYAWSYFYGDLYTHARPFKVQSLIERMWLASLLLVLAAFQTYLFSAVVRCSMYLSGIEDKRRNRATAFERCSERVRVAKENGLWRTTSWGGGFQQYKGQYDDSKDFKKKAAKDKGFRVKWNFNQNVVVEDEETPIIDKEERRVEPKSVNEKQVRTSESPRHNPPVHPNDPTPSTSTHEHRHHEHRRSVHSESPKKDRPRHHTVAKTSSEGSTDLPHYHEHKERRSSRNEIKHVEVIRDKERRPSTSSSPKREHRQKEIIKEVKETHIVMKPVNKHVQRPPLKTNRSVDSADSAVISVSSASKGRHVTRHSIDVEEAVFHKKHEIKPKVSSERHEQPVVKKISISSTSHPF